MLRFVYVPGSFVLSAFHYSLNGWLPMRYLTSLQPFAPAVMPTLQVQDEAELMKMLRLSSDVHLQCRTCMSLLNSRWFSNSSWNGKISSTQRTLNSLKKLNAILESDFLDIIRQLYGLASEYDYPGLRANGIRTFLLITLRCMTSLLTYLRGLNSFYLVSWSGTTSRLLISYVDCLGELHHCIRLLKDIPLFCETGCLFPRALFSGMPGGVQHTNSACERGNEESTVADDLTTLKIQFQNLQTRSDRVKQECFYGRCLGFYFCHSAQRILLVLSSFMAGYGNAYHGNKQGVSNWFRTVYHSVSSYLSPEDRGMRMAKLTRNAGVEFCKAFWKLAEHPLVTNGPHMISLPLAVTVSFELVPQRLQVPSNDKIGASLLSDGNDHRDFITVDSPTSHGGPAPIAVRILSYRSRPGLEWAQDSLLNRILPSFSTSPKCTDLHIKSPTSPTVWRVPSVSSASSSLTNSSKQASASASPYLLFYIHGGAFVALKSQSQDTFLRPWTKALDCPIFCVDYSLAPESPYPRAVEECFFAYCWATLNMEYLGAAPDARIVICGDSAGGNLALALCLRIAQAGLSYRPHGAFIAYAPVLMSFTPSPSRLLSVADPLLPVGILSKCVLAYAGVDRSRLDGVCEPFSTESASTDHERKLSRQDSLTNMFWNRIVPNIWTTSSTSSGNSIPHSERPMRHSTSEIVDLDRRPWGGCWPTGTDGTCKMANRTVSASPPREGKNTPPESCCTFTIPQDINKAEWAPEEPGQQPICRDPPSDLDALREIPIDQDMYMSPYLASDELIGQLPPLGIACSNLDPFLDDCLELAKRAKRMQVPVDLHILDDLPHAFLNFTPLGPEFQRANKTCIGILSKLLQSTTSSDEVTSSAN